MHLWLFSRPMTLVFGQRRALPVSGHLCSRDNPQAKLRITQGIQQQGGTSLVALGGQVPAHSYRPLFHSCTFSRILVPSQLVTMKDCCHMAKSVQRRLALPII